MMHKHADLELIWWLLKGSRAAVGSPRSRSSHGVTPRREVKRKAKKISGALLLSGNLKPAAQSLDPFFHLHQRR